MNKLAKQLPLKTALQYVLITFIFAMSAIGNAQELAVVCYEDWVKMVMCNWNDFDGTVENDIINLYQDYLVKAMKK